MHQYLYQQLRTCLWHLDSGTLDNACRATRDTIQLPDTYAAAVILECKRLFPSAESNSQADARVQCQIDEVVRLREKGHKSLKLDAADVVSELEKEFAESNIADYDHFKTLCRLLTTACEMAAIFNPAETDEPLIKDNRIQLHRLAILLQRSKSDHQAESRLRNDLYDDDGYERTEAKEQFHKLPYLRQLVQNAVDQEQLRRAAVEARASRLDRAVRRLKWTAVVAAFGIVVVFGFVNTLVYSELHANLSQLRSDVFGIEPKSSHDSESSQR